MLDTRDEALCLHSRLRLSAYERDMAFFLAENKAGTREIDDLLYVSQIHLTFERKKYYKKNK